MESARVRQMVIESAARAADLVGSPAVAAAWHTPSALDGMTVGALAAHLVRATGAVLAYLDRTSEDAEVVSDLLTKVTYFHAAIDAPIHERIKQVSADEADAGVEAVARRARQVAESLATRLPNEPADRLVEALGQRLLTLDDFCCTRMIEIGMHIDDLAVSVGVDTPDLGADVTAEIIEIVVGIARHLHGDWAVIHALARAERSTADVFPVF